LRGVPPPLSRIVRRAMAVDRERRYPTVGQLAEDLESWIERARPGFRLRPMWLAVGAVSLLLSWGATLLILLHSQEQDERRRVLQALRDGDRELAKAERRRADPAAPQGHAENDARAALADFSLARRWAGGSDPEAAYGIGRCLEFLGDDAKAEEAYREAESEVPAARAALEWLWARRLVEGRQDRDWKAFVLKNAGDRHPARLFAEG